MGTPETERVNVGPEEIIPLGPAPSEVCEICSRISGVAEPVNYLFCLILFELGFNHNDRDPDFYRPSMNFCTFTLIGMLDLPNVTASKWQQ